MNLSVIRKNLKLFFSMFTLLFAVAYFSSSFNYYVPKHSKADQKFSIEEFVTQASASVVSAGQQFNKITGLDHFVFDITLNSSSIESAQSKAFFISIFERNVFYVFTTIHAP